MESNITRRSFVGAASGVMTAGLAAEQAFGQAAAKPVKIIGISCSPRKGKTTSTALQAALEAAKSVNPATIEVELIELAGLKIDLNPAADQPDDMAKVIERVGDSAVGGIIIGSPVYMGTISTLCKVLLDRMMVLRRNNFALQNKVGGALAVGGVRNGGQETTLQAILLSLLCQDMVIVGDGKPTAHWGATLLNDGKDDVSADTFGLNTAKGLGKRVAEVALRQMR